MNSAEAAQQMITVQADAVAQLQGLPEMEQLTSQLQKVPESPFANFFCAKDWLLLVA